MVFLLKPVVISGRFQHRVSYALLRVGVAVMIDRGKWRGKLAIDFNPPSEVPSVPKSFPALFDGTARRVPK
jgi:hypothetical protein